MNCPATYTRAKSKRELWENRKTVKIDRTLRPEVIYLPVLTGRPEVFENELDAFKRPRKVEKPTKDRYSD